MSKSDKLLELDLNVKIEKYKPSMEEIQNYISVQRTALEQGSNITLNDYLKKKLNKGSNIVLVADLSNITFAQDCGLKTYDTPSLEDEGGNLISPARKVVDLKGVDFSGSIFSNTIFKNCDLENAVFCDADLKNTEFDRTTLKNIDFRGADLTTTRFAESYINNFEKIEKGGIKFSTTPALGRRYANIKADVFRKIEHQELLKQKEQEINDVYGQLTTMEQLSARRGVDTGNKKYDDLVTELEQVKAGGFPNAKYTEALSKKKQEVKEAYKKLGYTRFTTNKKDQDRYDMLSQELKEMKAQLPEKNYVMHPSFQNVFSSQSDIFDPAYIRGSSKVERDQPREYVSLSREDVETYLGRIKTEPELSLNDFAKEKFTQNGKELNSNTKYIADCSAKGNLDSTNSLKNLDLSNLDFSNANLQEACFAGANLENCKFNGANLSKATFESANLRGAEFLKTNARDATFFYSNMGHSSRQGTKIIESNFERAFMRGSEAVEAIVEKSNFNYSNICNGNWDQSVIREAHFDYADMEGISLAGAKLREVTMKHTLLDNAIMTNVELIKCDLTRAMMANVKAAKLNIKESILKDADAREINLEEAEIDKLSKLEGLDLERAIMEKIKADGVDFRKVNLAKADLRLAELRDANLEKVNAQFAKLEGAVIEGAKASGIDLTNAQLRKIQAAKADLTGAIMQGVKADEADFSDAFLEVANLQGAKLYGAIMNRAKVGGAQVDAATDTRNANPTDATGLLREYGKNGNYTEISLQQRVEFDNEIAAAEQKSWLEKKTGDFLRWCGSGVRKIGDFIGHPINDKWSRIIGGVVGALIIGTIALTAVATMGASLVVIAGVVAVAAAVGGIGGAAAGHYGAKKITATHLAGAGVGLVVGGPIGAAVGLATGEVAEQVTQGLTGQTASQLLGERCREFGDFMEQGGNNLGVSPEVQRRMDERTEVEKYPLSVKLEMNDDRDDRTITRKCLDKIRQADRDKGNLSKETVLQTKKEKFTKAMTEIKKRLDSNRDVVSGGNPDNLWKKQNKIPNSRDSTFTR